MSVGEELHLQQELERVVVSDSALAASHCSQVGEPNTGNPELVVRRMKALKLLPLLSGHESCTDGRSTAPASLLGT